MTYQEFVETYGKRPPDIVFAVTQKDTKTETLKELGEWLWRHYRDKTGMKMPHGYLGFDILGIDLEALKRGELPKE